MHTTRQTVERQERSSVSEEGGEQLRNWLKKLREESGMTQKQVGKELDISESYYAYIENGDRQKAMDISLARKLSKVFNVSIEQIVEFESTLTSK